MSLNHYTYLGLVLVGQPESAEQAAIDVAGYLHHVVNGTKRIGELKEAVRIARDYLWAVPCDTHNSQPKTTPDPKRSVSKTA